MGVKVQGVKWKITNHKGGNVNYNEVEAINDKGNVDEKNNKRSMFLDDVMASTKIHKT